MARVGRRWIWQSRRQEQFGNGLLEEDRREEVEGPGGFSVLEQGGAGFGTAEVAQVSADLDLSKLLGMSFVVEADEAANPIDVGTDKGQRVAAGIKGLGQSIEKPKW